MKKIGLIFTFLFILFKVFSCEIVLTIEKGQRDKYKKGDEVIVKVEVLLTHRNCSHVLDETKFETSGVKILSATKWKEIEKGMWVKKLKIKITAEQGTKARLEVKRICEKGGATKFLEFSS